MTERAVRVIVVKRSLAHFFNVRYRTDKMCFYIE